MRRIDALARLAYETMWLRTRHPAVFYCALLNNQPMGFYLPVDIDASGARCSLEGTEPSVRLGLARVKGVGQAAAELVVAEREAGGPYRSLADLSRRTGLAGRPLENLALAGAFDGWGAPREELLWDAYALTGGGARELDLPEERPELPEHPAHERTRLDYMVLGFSLDRHLVGHYRRRLAALRVTPSAELARRPEGSLACVGGLVVCRQRPQTAKGFVFLTLEDTDGLVNVIVRPDVYARYRDALRDQSLVAVAGRVQRSTGILNVLAERAVGVDLGAPDAETGDGRTPLAVGSPVAARDFR